MESFPTHRHLSIDPIFVSKAIGWYNEVIKPIFHLNYPYDTLAILIISTPQMFEKAFKPFITSCQLSGLFNPIDECMIYHLNYIKQLFPNMNIEIIHDFEMHAGRRPKVLMQTVAHVSGSAYYYQRSNLKVDPWNPNKKIYGVCIHPKYGGWFALRAIIIFKDFICSYLLKKEPEDIVPENKKQELLEKFNYNWESWSYRDIIPVSERYSEEQKKYFATKPGQRLKIIDDIRNSVNLCV